MIVEDLESRLVPAPLSWPGFQHPFQPAGPHATLAQAYSLGNLDASGTIELVGRIGKLSEARSATVDWYQFTLDRPSAVRLATADHGRPGALAGVLSLYNDDPADCFDPYNPVGHRLLAQDTGETHGGDASIGMYLAPGTYFVAVSGAGNQAFHPLIAGSGLPGAAGPYGLRISATIFDLPVDDGPTVLNSDPIPGAVLAQSPFVLRVGLSSALDPNSVWLDNNVQLLTNPTGQFGNGQDELINLAGSNFSVDVNELQLSPIAPLAPGYYELVLNGTSANGAPPVTDVSGLSLGKDELHPDGATIGIPFQVAGVEGNAGAQATGDDDPAQAHDLGDITRAGLVQRSGAIGDNPGSAVPFDAADIDLYRFRIKGPGRYRFEAEVFAGRIGSGLTLFRRDPADHLLHRVAANDDSLNQTRIANGRAQPLRTDSVLVAGLEAGEYFVAISSGGDTATPPLDWLVDGNGVYAPDFSRSNEIAPTTGPYLLNLHVEADATPPQVVSVKLADGTPLREGMVLSAPPTSFQMTLSEPTLLPQLANQAFLAAGDTLLNAVTIQGPKGDAIYPRLVKAEDNGSVDQFACLDALPNGAYELHLSGSQGLTDDAGNPLVGHGPHGDFVLHFQVQGPARGTGNVPTVWHTVESNDSFSHPQVIGELFPAELADGVTIIGASADGRLPAPADNVDYFAVQVEQTRRYTFILSANGLSDKADLELYNDQQALVPGRTVRSGDSIALAAKLTPGTYFVRVADWATASTVGAYQLQISINRLQEPPPPLTLGAAPAIRFRVAAETPAAASTPIPAAPVAPMPPSPAASSASEQTLPIRWTGQAEGIVAEPANRLATAISAPPDILLSAAAGPLGRANANLSAPSGHEVDPYTQWVAAAPDLLVTQFVPLPVLVQGVPAAQQSSTPANGLSPLIQSIARRIEAMQWSRAVELLHAPSASVETTPLAADSAADWTGMESISLDNTPSPSVAEEVVETERTTVPGLGLRAVVLAVALAYLRRFKESPSLDSHLRNPTLLAQAQGSSAS